MSLCRQNVPSIFRRSRLGAERGTSLVEVLVALTLVTTLFIAALSMMTLDQRVYAKDDAVLEATAEGRHALGVLERAILMAGYQVDVRTIADLGPDGLANTDDDTLGQEKLVLAGPWELVFNADIDPEVDALRDGLANDSTPTGYAPVTFFTGAETVRFTLDSNASGTVTADDRRDEADEISIQNPSLYMLQREIYGYDGSSNVVQQGGVSLIRGPAAYPSGAIPSPLFLYWGHFDSDPALDLWGDTGVGGGTAGNGILEAGEVAAIGNVTDEDADDDGVIDTGEDRNGNGILESWISDLIIGIEIRITTETAYPDPHWVDPHVSTTGDPYRYRIRSIGTKVEPRNMELPGGACGDDPEPTSGTTVTNACAHPLADGRIDVSWGLSVDDGGFETDVDRYLVFKTNANSLFGPTPHAEVPGGTATWTDGFFDARTWPPTQAWYRIRALDCTPALSIGDPTTGAYPVSQGPKFPVGIQVRDVAGDDGTSLEAGWMQSPDDPANTTGYGGDVGEYHVYRSTQSDYRCVEPVNNAPIAATGSSDYIYLDNAGNSASAPIYGELYYYWLRARDSAPVLSPYSARACARPYRGPAMPVNVQARVATYAATDHPAEVWFEANDANPNAGYDPYKIEYRIYKSHDVTGDGIGDTLVDDPIGYTTSDQVGSVKWTGLAWLVGDGASCRHQTIDGGLSWRTGSGSLAPSLRAVDFHDRLNGIAVGSFGNIERTVDGGATYFQLASPTSTQLRDVVWLTESRIVAVGALGEILYSQNSGTSWQAAASPSASNLTAVDAAAGVVVAVGDANTVIYSTDGGVNWVSPASLPTDNLTDVCLIGSVANPTILAAGTAGRVWVTHNSGATWTPQLMPTFGPGDIVGLDCTENGVAMVVSPDSSPFQIYRSQDFGDTWNPELLTLATRTVDIGLADDRVAYAVDDGGIVHRRDPSGSWSSSTADGSCTFRGIAVRPEIAWEHAGTATDPPGRNYYYVVTSAYDESNATLDGESGLLPDRDSSFESPNDSLDQVLVDSCKNFEVSTSQP